MQQINSILKRNMSVWLIAGVLVYWSMSAASDCEAEMFTVPAVELNAAGEVITHFEMRIELRPATGPETPGLALDGTDGFAETAQTPGIFYNNTITGSPTGLSVTTSDEVVDYGVSPGGIVQRYAVSYFPPLFSSGDLLFIDTRFYRDVTFLNCPTFA